jgi:hypothetical protein
VPWIELFLAAVGTQAADAVVRSQRIVELRERYRAAASAITSNKAIALVDLICETPIISSHAVEISSRREAQGHEAGVVISRGS